MGNDQSALPLLQALNDDDQEVVNKYLDGSFSARSLNSKICVKNVKNLNQTFGVFLFVRSGK